MRREAGPLVFLEHIVSPTIGLDEIEIWLHRARGIIDKPEGRFLRAWLSIWQALHIRGPIHRTSAELVQIAHSNEGAVVVIDIVAEAERVGVWIGRPGG